MSRFKTPLIILILGILPFWFFIGSINSATINGQIVHDSQFNLAGLIMGVIGVSKAWKAIRNEIGADRLALALTIVGAAVCLVQIAHSTEIFRLPI